MRNCRNIFKREFACIWQTIKRLCHSKYRNRKRQPQAAHILNDASAAPRAQAFDSRIYSPGKSSICRQKKSAKLLTSQSVIWFNWILINRTQNNIQVNVNTSTSQYSIQYRNIGKYRMWGQHIANLGYIQSWDNSRL